MSPPSDRPTGAGGADPGRAPELREGELAGIHAELLRRWATPGSYWTSAQRLAVVEEVRRARDAEPMPAWVTPSTLDGSVPADGPLPAVAVDAVWRITNHPGTLTANWYHSIIARGLEPGAYVELVALVAQANCVDRFTDALALDRYELPAPEPGEPVRQLAPDAAVRYHWVPTAAVRGPNVIKALSLLPFENESRRLLSEAHYVPEAALLGDLRSDRGGLSRPQIELIAARTSTLNECFY